jgi:integrase
MADRYEKWARQERPRSYGFRQKALIHLRAAFGHRVLGDIKRGDVETYMARRQAEGAAPATVNRERSVLSHLFSVTKKWGFQAVNPVSDTERLREPHEKPRPLTLEEEASLFRVIPAHYIPFVRLAVQTGLRLGELRAQLWRDVDLQTGTLTVTQPKSGKVETVMLNTVAREVLAAIERTSPLVFPDMPKKLTDLFKRYVAKARLPKEITFHCLRDTFISRVASHVSVPDLMQLARHRDYRTTRRYVKSDEKRLRDAVERLAAETRTATRTEQLTVAEVLDNVVIVDDVE